MVDYEKYICKHVMVEKKNGNMFVGEMIDYDYGFDDDSNEEKITIIAVNWPEYPCQEIKISDIVLFKEV